MRLSDIRGERSLDVLADLIDPVSEIMQDEKVASEFRSGQRLQAAKTLLKEHKKQVIHIMALLDGEDPETYEPTLIQLPKKVLEVLNDPDLADLFTSGEELTSSGSPMESTEVKEK